MGLFSKLSEIIDDVKFEIQDTMIDLRYGDTSDKIKAVAKVAKVGADVAMLTTGVGQVAKTATTATKLATCGYCHSAKAVASLTAHAQKSNMIKAGTKMAEAAAVKATASVAENMSDKTNNNYIESSYNTTKDNWNSYIIDTQTPEEKCKEKVRNMLLTGRWNMMDAVEYVKKELYSDIPEVCVNTIAYQFVLDVRKANNIN